MDARTYCRNMASEITGWKAKTYELMRQIDYLEAIDKRPVSKIRAIHETIDSLEHDIEALRNECPAEWSAAKGDIDKKVEQLNAYWEDLALYAAKEAPCND